MGLSAGAIVGIVFSSIAGDFLLVGAIGLIAYATCGRRSRGTRAPVIWTYTEGVVWNEPPLDPSFRLLGVRYVGEEVELGVPWERLASTPATTTTLSSPV
jgi:hypothetical protein